jgi:hypothetical protein
MEGAGLSGWKLQLPLSTCQSFRLLAQILWKLELLYTVTRLEPGNEAMNGGYERG